jgi:TonB family protein
MKAVLILLLPLLLCPLAAGQAPIESQSERAAAQAFSKQAHADGVYVFVSSAIAKSLLTHRVEPVLPHGDYMARVSGTVIIAFEITREGSVRHATPVSGPKLLQAPVLKAVRQWQFNPYHRNGKPITVATSVSLTVSNF